MAETQDTRSRRRVFITIGIVVAALILIAVAVYAVAFLILAPMMA
jgi:preprotein translocase subunit SecE